MPKPTRYPNAHPSGSPKDLYTEEEVRRLIKHAKKIIKFCRIFYPEFDWESLIRRTSGRLRQIMERLPLKLVVLFGSYAKGNYIVGSDVDLLIVYDGTKREDAYAIVKRVIDVPRPEPHIYSLPEYEEMKETIEKMKKDGFVLLDKWNRKRNENLA